VLCPIYQAKEDDVALEIIRKAYPMHKIMPIDCLPLVEQYGSLHCITMQVPVGVFKPEISSLFGQGAISLN
jgi:agmatine/peptidylarginine deiminase